MKKKKICLLLPALTLTDDNVRSMNAGSPDLDHRLVLITGWWYVWILSRTLFERETTTFRIIGRNCKIYNVQMSRKLQCSRTHPRQTDSWKLPRIATPETERLLKFCDEQTNFISLVRMQINDVLFRVGVCPDDMKTAKQNILFLKS